METNIFSYIEQENDIDRLKRTVRDFIEILISETEYYKKRAETFEFITGSIDTSVEFDYCENPEVSIIIPVQNEFILTSALLYSIKNNTQGIKYEVIIADDGSTDETIYIEQIFKNVRRIVNDSNSKGFIYNVSNAAENAKGEYLFLLNNDMVTMPGYLSELLKVIKSDPKIGIAGSKTLNTELKTMECGVKMYKGGNIKFIGKNQDKDIFDDSDFIVCDYCSGCSILFSADIWKKSGGFDKNLAPAYFEDSDFALNLKHNFGLKSVCVPKSKLFHFRGLSYKKNPDLINIFNKNKQYFVEKWNNYLLMP